MSNPIKSQLHLDPYSDEVEIMEFMLGGRSFGINVAKVLEIMQIQDVTPIPHSNPYVEGVFKPRDNIITVVNLAGYLNLPDSENPERDILIITNFSQTNIAFHVHTVEVIHRISWDAMEKPDKTIFNGMDSVTTGITRIDDKLITILDFEKVMGELNPTTSIQLSDLDGLENTDHKTTKTIFVVEDSLFLLELIKDCLMTAGYSNLRVFSNGADAWAALSDIKNLDGPLTDHVACVITDIEMPQMDGHTLTKLIKEDVSLKVLPVIIFSSLINSSMLKKGESVGADMQISKPDIKDLVQYLDKHLT